MLAEMLEQLAQHWALHLDNLEGGVWQLTLRREISEDREEVLVYEDTSVARAVRAAWAGETPTSEVRFH
jgi:hypothetical protein